MDVVLICGKRRYVCQVEPSCSIGELKAQVCELETEVNFVKEAQRILLKGKERKDEEIVWELLTDAEKKKDKVVLKGKILLAKDFANIFDTAPVKQELDQVEPQPVTQEVVVAPKEREISTDDLKQGQILLTVQCGNRKIQVVAPSANWKVQDVKLFLQSKLTVHIKQQRLLIKGKVRENTDTLASCGIEPPSGKAMLLFTDGYHQANDGEEYLQIAEEELAAARKEYEKMQSRIDHRLVDFVELIVDIDCLIDRLENLEGGLERPVPMSSADRKLRVINDLPEMISKLKALKQHRAHGEK